MAFDPGPLTPCASGPGPAVPPRWAEALCLGRQVAWWGSSCGTTMCPALGTPLPPGLGCWQSGAPRRVPRVLLGPPSSCQEEQVLREMSAVT